MNSEEGPFDGNTDGHSGPNLTQSSNTITAIATIIAIIVITVKQYYFIVKPKKAHPRSRKPLPIQ